jgi:hypothetical protein
VPVADFQANLGQIIERCRSVGAEVVLCTPNSVVNTPNRPIPKLVEYCDATKAVASTYQTPVCDVYAAYESLRARDPLSWRILLSDEIHPNMLGHKLNAEAICRTVTGQEVSLRDVPAQAPESLRFTLARLKAGQPVNVIAMPPYDGLIRETLGQLYPNAQVHVTTWPVEGQTLAQLVEWGKGIRGRKPDLVVPAVPAAVAADSDEAFIHGYSWVLSWSAAFDQAAWDVLPILPNVAGPVPSERSSRVDLLRRIAAGCDVEYLDRREGDTQPAGQFLGDWIRQRMAKP